MAVFPFQRLLRDGRLRVRSLATVLSQVRATVRLAWEADRASMVWSAGLTLLAALFPPAIVYVGKLVVDGVLAAAKTRSEALSSHTLWLVALEFALVLASAALGRLIALVHEVLQARLTTATNLKILHKALALELRHFEDPQVHDTMQKARRVADSRPLVIVVNLFSTVQHGVTLASYAALLLALSPWSALILVAASLPAFFVEARLARESFELHSERAGAARRLDYLEWLLTRDNHAKEVKLYGLGSIILDRYQRLARLFYERDRKYERRRLSFGLGFGALSILAFYGCYAFVVARTVMGVLTLGEMILYIAVFRQGQTALQATLLSIGSVYRESLFMSDLFQYLAVPTDQEGARVLPPRSPVRGRAQTIEFRDVSFRYAGQQGWALRHVNLTLPAGEKLAVVGENGAGKSTFVKLLLRFYEPTEGSITYGGVDLRDMDPGDLRSRFSAVFQDFVRYQFSAADNIGLGDTQHWQDAARIQAAAEKGGASTLIESLPRKLDTLLGLWFESGQDLSVGQWQKLAVSRAFMRDAEALILDEPTASLDARAEQRFFESFRALAEDRTALIISHRFSTVRIADRVVVLHNGEIQELGSHEELLRRGGQYAHLFQLHADGHGDEPASGRAGR
ncbi:MULTISPECIES: ABC transporter ATP-binding protein [Corallococcus]|uniref:ABC transporter ATP-binding protein n=1 Tax=Corallococcus TaxID=83461 RepID=UPI0021064ABF|nr:ABC transporter ATP-binding protein [Corallococcus sp. CA041A]